MDQRFDPSGLEITSAIPPVFDDYATIVLPDDHAASTFVLLDLLAEGIADQPWWLGYLDTGIDDVIFSDAPKVRLYAGWEYVLVQAGANGGSPLEGTRFRLAGSGGRPRLSG